MPTGVPRLYPYTIFWTFSSSPGRVTTGQPHQFRRASTLFVSRPNLLMVEPEPEEALSTRKLVLETAKFNVITAHSGKEASELLHLFPNISALVLHGEIKDVTCEQLVREAKQLHARLPVIVLSARGGFQCPPADHNVSSHSPEDLLFLLRDMFGDPRSSAA